MCLCAHACVRMCNVNSFTKWLIYAKWKFCLFRENRNKTIYILDKGQAFWVINLWLNFDNVWDIRKLSVLLFGRCCCCCCHLVDSTGSLLSGLSPDQIVPNLMSPVQSSGIHLGLQVDHFSRKVFIGGLPPDIAEGEATLEASLNVK